MYLIFFYLKTLFKNRRIPFTVSKGTILLIGTESTKQP